MSGERQLMESLVSRGSVRRRGFLRDVGIAGLVVGAPSLLSACGTEAARQSTDSCQTEDKSASEKTLTISNWPLYIDEAKRDGQTVYPTLRKFEEQTGIKVNYTTDYNDNNEFFGIVRNQLADCQTTGRDMFMPTDWMAARMIDLGWIQKVDKSQLPNVDANLADSLRSPRWDPHRDYSVPWQSFLTGIAYNADLVDEVGSFEDLLSRSDLKGKVSLLSEMHDTMVFLLLMTGADPAEFTEDEFGAAIDRLAQAVDAGQIRAFTGNDYAQDLVKGNVVACEAWSGDVIQLQIDNPNIKFVAPEEGLSLSSDNMLVPNQGQHKANAEAWMNFYYDPEIAAELAAWVNYICPVKGAQEAIAKIDPHLAENELIFPTATTLAKSHQFMGLDTKTEQKYQRMFADVIGA